MAGLTDEQRFEELERQLNLLMEKQIRTPTVEDAAKYIEKSDELIQGLQNEVKALERAIERLQYEVQQIQESRS